MKEKQRRRERAFRWLMVGFLCAVAVSLCLTSCKIGRSNNANDEESRTDTPSVKDDAYESKILYYEAQIQSLNTQLGDMEQQMLLMRDDYLKQLQSLKDSLPKDDAPGEQAPEQNDNIQESGDEKEQLPPSSATVNVETESADTVVLKEYTYRMENGCAILTSYLGDDSQVSVPAAVDGHLVIGLDDRTFAGCDIKSVRLPETIERIDRKSVV